MLRLIALTSALLVCVLGSGYEQNCPTLFNYYGDKYDCTKFYRCVWGKAKQFRCPAGTHWSQQILACDHIKNVKCYKSGTPDQIYGDDYTGQYFNTYGPEVGTPDFSTADYGTTYNNHHNDYDGHGTYPGNDYGSTYGDYDDYVTKPDYGQYQPHLGYHKDSIKAYYGPDYSTTYQPHSTYNAHHGTADRPIADYFKGYPSHFQYPGHQGSSYSQSG